jgi:chromosome segregation ATPase
MTEDLEELQNRLFGVLQDFSRQRSSSAAENETRLLSMAREIDSLRQQLKDEKESKQRDAATRSLELDERTNTLLKQLQQQQSDIECLRGDNTTLTQQLRDLQQRFVASQERLKATELADETLQHAIARIAAVEKEKTELLAEVASCKHQADVCLQRATTAEREVQYVESRCSQANSRAESLQEQVYRLSRDAVLCKTCDILKKDLSATQYELRRSQDGSVEALVRFGTFVMEQVEGASREALQNMYHEMASRHKSDLDWLADKFQEAVTVSTRPPLLPSSLGNILTLQTFKD